MVKLKRLKINKYRNVRPGTELRFDDGFNLILGKNGGGKTTLLGLIATVVSSDFTELRDEAFAFEYVLATDEHTLSVTIESSGHAGFDDDTEVSLAAGSTFTYLVSCHDKQSRAVFTIDGNSKRTIIVENGESSERSSEPPYRPGFFVGAVFDPLEPGLFDTLLDLYAGSVARFDESLGTFYALTGRASPTLGVAAAPELKLRVTRVGTEVHTRVTGFAPRELGRAFLEAPGGEILLDLTTGAPIPPEFDFLRAAAQNIGALTTSCRPASKTLTENAARGIASLEIHGLAFSFKRANGMTLEHDLLSYGQKRLLSFFYYLTTTKHIVIADELVNGLHHRWIEACIEAIGERQAFLTSQNPLLFDYIPDFDSVEQVESRFITCRTEIVDGAEQLVWQNMPHEHARIFFEAYKDEVEQVGEILIARGLW